MRPLYASAGCPLVDPVVFFKLQLVMFFEDLLSERQLMSVVADRLSLRWYLGYDLHEPLPDHSSLSPASASATVFLPSVASSWDRLSWSIDAPARARIRGGER